MDDEQLATLLNHFAAKSGQSGEEDYKDFLVNYLHAINAGAQDDQLKMMRDAISPARIGGMIDYDRQRGMDPNPTVELESMGLGKLLRRQ